MATVELSGVRKAFGSVEVIKGVDLFFRDGEFIVFVGPSGCGKSTLLRLIAGLEDITDGTMEIDGERMNELPPSRRGISMVFQSYALFPHMSVRENMSFGLRIAKAPQAEIEAKVDEAARILQLEPLMDRRPKDLSGGQRQRVAIGRSIVRNPRVFLFDEPLSNLDAALRVQMRIQIARLHTDLGANMVYVTHDQTEAMTLADRIVVLSAGRVEQVGAPLELYHHPVNRFVAGFIGSPKMNFLPVEVVQQGDGEVRVALPGGSQVDVPCDSGAQPGQNLELGIRPEHIALGSDGDGGAMRGEALVVEHLGGETFSYVRLEDGAMVTLKTDGDSPQAVGERIEFRVPPARCHLFDADGNTLGNRARPH